MPRNREAPHRVTITKAFWLGQTAVTVGAWKQYRAATGAPPLPGRDAYGRLSPNEASGNDSLPVGSVLWDEAMSFCEWGGGRLPTEAEWEYAGRAGNSSARYGNLDEIARYGDFGNGWRTGMTKTTISDRRAAIRLGHRQDWYEGSAAGRGPIALCWCASPLASEVSHGALRVSGCAARATEFAVVPPTLAEF